MGIVSRLGKFFPSLFSQPIPRVAITLRSVVEYWRRHDPKYTRKEGNKVLVTDLAFNNWNRDSSLDVDIWPDWVGP
jgi:hypothetical protein